MECIRVGNARHKVIIFCKSCPLNWQLEDNNNQQRNQASSTTKTTRLSMNITQGGIWMEIYCWNFPLSMTINM